MLHGDKKAMIRFKRHAEVGPIVSSRQPRVPRRIPPAERILSKPSGYDLQNFAKAPGLGNTLSPLKGNGIDLSVLPDLTDQDLEKLGSC